MKSEQNVHAQSLKVYRDIFKPIRAFRASLAPRHFGENLIDFPLYAMENLREMMGVRENEIDKVAT